MLKTLSLSNWCCHASLTVDFDPSATVLWGNNGVGKSAALRALWWLCLGQWAARADAHITWGQRCSEARLETDQHTVVRVKGKDTDGKSVNHYVLDSSVLAFDATQRRGVPIIVADALRLGPDNFQGQHDASFWFALSAGDVAKALNRIINLEAIDSSLANIGKEVREAKAAETASEKRLESLRNLTESLSWVAQAEADWCTIEQVEERIALESARIAAIERSITEGQRLALIRDRASTLALDAKRTLSAMNKLWQAEKAHATLEACIRALQECATRRSGATSQLKQTEAVYARYRASRCPLCGK